MTSELDSYIQQGLLESLEQMRRGELSPFVYSWRAPSGVLVESCKPERRDEWTRFGSGWYALRSYWNWALVISGYADWAKKRKKAKRA